MKKCYKCGRVLPESEFYKMKKYLQSYCKDCKRTLGRARYGRKQLENGYTYIPRKRYAKETD